MMHISLTARRQSAIVGVLTNNHIIAWSQMPSRNSYGIQRKAPGSDATLVNDFMLLPFAAGGYE